MPPISETRAALAVVLLLLAPLAGVGLALMNTGLGRLRNAAHAMVAALCVIAVASCAYFVLGASIQGFAGGASHAIGIAGKQGVKPWDWTGARPLFLGGMSAGDAGPWLAAWMGLVSVATAALIPLGSGADRWRLSAACGATALFSALTFPLFAHWVWGGGWLAQLGANYGMGRGYLDAGGSGPIHAAGGLTALAISWIVGPRRGKYGHDGMPMAIPGHNAVFVVFGCLLGSVGWIALNAAGAILFAGVETLRIAPIAVNTLVSAAGAALAAAVVTRVKYGKPDASLTANGWTAGIAGIAAGSAFLPPAAALIVGLVAGGAVTFAVELIDIHIEIDDPGGSLAVHAMGGLWGVLAVGLFGGREAAGDGQMLAQLVAVATLLGFVLPLTWGLNALLNLRLRQRVEPEGEHQGMDLYELGAGAYPEFVTHADDHLQR